jgi:transcription elongation factor Elf1
MPIIIYGSRGVTSELSSGDFHCPHCGNPSEYKLKQIRRFFTLFFIPIFPISSGVRFVECGHCGSQFEEAVLDYEPPSEEAQNFVREADRCLKDGMSLEATRDQLAAEGHDPGRMEALLMELCNGHQWRCDCGLRYHPSVTRCAKCGKEL